METLSVKCVHLSELLKGIDNKFVKSIHDTVRGKKFFTEDAYLVVITLDQMIDVIKETNEDTSNEYNSEAVKIIDEIENIDKSTFVCFDYIPKR